MHLALDTRATTRLIRYAVICAVAVVIAIPVGKLWRHYYGLTFLHQANELAPIKQVVDQQVARGAIYGSAVFEDSYDYKLQMIRAIKPTVVALGSSRALQFRQEAFAAPFVNAGRAVNSIDEGARFVPDMLAVHRPRLVLLSIDFWWLNPVRRSPPTKGRGLNQTAPLIEAFWSYIGERKLSFGRTVSVMLGDDSNPISTRPAMGIAALARGIGFRPDGSRDYGSRYFGTDPAFDDVKFADSLSRVRRGRSLLSHGENIDRQAIGTLRQIIDQLQAAGVVVIGVLPPVAGTVFDLMQQRAANYGYLQPAREAFRSLPIRVFDFIDPRSIGAPDCEFADGLHGGDIVHQRMLLEIGEQMPEVRAFLNIDEMRRNVRAFAGRAVTPTQADGYRYPETDFLRIGCKK